MAIRADEINLDDDRQLVEAWQAGDASAFEELYRRHFHRLHAFCQRRVVDRTEAEDLAQEAFLKALHALPRLAGERRFYPWMTVIAARLCIDHHRRHGRVEPRDELDTAVAADDQLGHLDLQDDLRSLDRALERLADRHVEVLDLRERRGLTYDEIAGELGVPHSTVEARLFRARRALRREFLALSGDRLVAVPGFAWLGQRMTRLRDRVGSLVQELGPLAGPVATGAVAAVLVAIPVSSPPPARAVAPASAVHAPAAVAAASPPDGGTTPSASESPTAPPPDPSAAAANPGIAEATPLPVVEPMSDDEARERATGMPVHVDVLGEVGAAINPDPLLDRAPATRREP